MKKILYVLAFASACVAQQYIGSPVVQEGGTNFGGVDTGTGNSFVCTSSTDAQKLTKAFVKGATYSCQASHDNTGAATLTFDGHTAPLKKIGGTVDLASGAIKANDIFQGEYDGTAVQVTSISNGTSSSSSSNTSIPGTQVSAGSPMYLYSHFRPDKTSLFLSASLDGGVNWKTLNPGGSCLSTVSGEVRDPSVMLLSGTYYFVSTSATAGSITYWTSTDLVSCTTPTTVSFSALSTANPTWAPEWFQDGANTYVIVSAKVGGSAGVYRIPWTTSGFGTPTAVTLSRTNPSYDLYDTFMVKVGSTYYLFFVEGAAPNHNPSNIVWATSSSFTGTYTQIASGNTSGIPGLPTSLTTVVPVQAEGPAIFQLPGSSCYRIVGDVFSPYNDVFSYNSVSNDYHQEYVDTCDNFATFTSPQYFNLNRSEQGTIIPITSVSDATTVMNAMTIGNTTSNVAGNFGINHNHPRFTIEMFERGATNFLAWAPPATIAGNSGNGVVAAWSACSTPGTDSPYCQHPAITTGSWMMNSNPQNIWPQITVNNWANKFSGMDFADQLQTFATGTPNGTGHTWSIGENDDFTYDGTTQHTGMHYFRIKDKTSNFTQLMLNPTTGQAHVPHGLTFGDKNLHSYKPWVGLDAASAGVLNCGNGTLGDTSCTLNVGTLNASVINGATSTGGSVGYANVAPNTNTSTVSKIVVVGDSHMFGLGQTASIPSQVVPSEPFTLVNQAVSGSKFCAYFADNGVHEAATDALYDPQARANIIVLEGGGNDMIDNNTGTPAVPWITARQVYDCQVAYAKRRQALGWKVIIYGMYSRGQTGIGGLSGDQLKTQLNGFYNAGAQSTFNGYVNVSIDPNIGADGASTNTTYFQGDSIHVNSSYTATLANVLRLIIDQISFGYKAPNFKSESLWPAENNFQYFANLHPSFSGAVGSEFVTAGRDYFTGVTGPSNSLANVAYMFDNSVGHGYFPWTLKDKLWSWGVNEKLNPTSTAPSCSVNADDGNTWYDTTDSSNSHYKICMKTGGSVSWYTVH